MIKFAITLVQLKGAGKKTLNHTKKEPARYQPSRLITHQTSVVQLLT